jgi:tetraacyldisaccharide 4'-kinase
MRPPAFWFTDPARPAPAARALAPIARAYAAATARRIARARPLRLPVPVICIGNLNAGGTGKTPTVIALAQRLAARGIEVHIVTRGHGGRLAGPVRVDPRRHSAAETGDEALLHAAFAPTWVARDRAAGAQAAHQAGARAILLDDGHQNPALARSLSIIVVDAARGFGNGRVLPAGPLREPVAAGLARADLLLSLGDRAAQESFSAAWGHAIGALPHLTGTLAPLPTGLAWTGRPILAFAGIGDPEKFFATLRALGADLVRTVPLDDHQPVPPALFARLEAEARRRGADLVTTEKDAVRLAPADRGRVLTLPVRLQLDDWTVLDAALTRLGLGPGSDPGPPAPA